MKTTKKNRAAGVLLGLVFLGAVASCGNGGAQQTYDLVILNGRVIDPETNFDDIRNVGIDDGMIAVITEDNIAGARTIDANGHVVAPGFIDLHAHGQDLPDHRVQAIQGVTTVLELESGILPIADWYESQAEKRLPLTVRRPDTQV